MRGLILLAAVFQLCQGAPREYYDLDDLVQDLIYPDYITDTEAFVPSRPILYYGKREAKADPQSVIIPNINNHPATLLLDEFASSRVRELSKLFG